MATVEAFAQRRLAAGEAATIEAVARGAGVHYHSAQRRLKALWEAGVLRRHWAGGRLYYEGRQLSLPLH
jgi:DNA-binding IclR family transcriptional regulator